MPEAVTTIEAEFDEYAGDYDAALNQGLSASGESKEYFAQGRVDWLAAILKQRQFTPRRIMDFGCGTGASTPFLLDTLQSESLIGVDVSRGLLEVAAKNFGSARARFSLIAEYDAPSEIDLAFCNGVFHHIPPKDRAEAVELFRSHCVPADCSPLGKQSVESRHTLRHEQNSVRQRRDYSHATRSPTTLILCGFGK